MKKPIRNAFVFVGLIVLLILFVAIVRSSRAQHFNPYELNVGDTFTFDQLDCEITDTFKTDVLRVEALTVECE